MTEAKRYIVKESRSSGDWLVIDTKRARAVVISPSWTDANEQAEKRNRLVPA